VTAATRIAIHADVDIISARERGRALGTELGFHRGDLALIATAISELARNILTYAGHGEIGLERVEENGTRGIAVIAHDEGPGIADLSLALQDGYSTSRSLGIGLPGVRRLMDEFEVESAVGEGTTITAKKWC
jgi:serine/threonine-protein kinase RsbT